MPRHPRTTTIHHPRAHGSRYSGQNSDILIRAPGVNPKPRCTARYAGSSGSALLHGQTGELVGIHTGFDHKKFSAEGVTLEAVRKFLAQYGG